MKTRRRGRPVWPVVLAVGLVVGVVIAMAFFVRGFDDTGGDYAAPAATPTTSDTTPTSMSTRPRVSAPSHGATKYVVEAGGPTITLGAKAGSGLTIVDNRHRLVARVTSSEPIYAVGWLIPTSLDYSYGKNMHPGRTFTIDTQVSGRPKYSLLWVYAGASGAPATCTISVDGQVRSTLTTRGPYGRQVCYA